MKLFQAVHEYAQNWATVTAAHWQKYPNDKTPHVIHVETLNRSVDPDTGVLKTERLILCRQPCPAIIARFLGSDDVSYVLEYSEVDPQHKVLRAVSTNLTYHNVVAVNEELTYSADTSQPHLQRTQFKQSAQITAFSMISRISGYVEEFCVKRFHENAQIGKRALEQVLEKLDQAKVAATSTTHLPM
ncbi:Phospholipid metabolism protein [Dimargaris cristalligena]|uniref:PRELI-like family-domain-containing protein n=1 Tax=Dimargaris cristalligena TaxID=215637 RepID=A0A4P9ZR33_9FUNG|nr:Phospholipid metabolism protein [Dimargaris cristalligena]RKP35608.1 PRELI-like family-domain-containing protein [Dimargaris cristalligena]|eukprot:RKP35608.1 PRELI-like family-domain-containing protein [Dimargaris cristalligena]